MMDKQKIEFVKKCGEILKIAKPHLVRCELKLGKDIEDVQAKRGHPALHPEEEYVVVTCENGCTYNICVAANSLCAIASAIFSQMSHK
jgi:hypothetical protein